MRAATLFCLLPCLEAVRVRRRTKRGRRANDWTTVADSSHGPCADHLDVSPSIHFPLLCTGEAGSLKFTATARGWGWSPLHLEVDGEPLGKSYSPLFPGAQTWEVESPPEVLSAGLHMVKFSGDRRGNPTVSSWGKWMTVAGAAFLSSTVVFSALFCICSRVARAGTGGGVSLIPGEAKKRVGQGACLGGCALWVAGIVVGGLIGFGGANLESLTLTGSGDGCSFDVAPGYAQAAASYTYSGLDALNRMFGPDKDFSEFKKRQLHFASQSLGWNADGSIDATVVAEGWWKWLFRYSQDQSPDDLWLGNKRGPSDMYEESNIVPYLNVSLDPLPGHSGQTIVSCEACNGLSNLAFAEAAVWITCKGHPFDRDEYASLITALSSLAAGSSFMHMCACRRGHLADTFPMHWSMLQVYQIMVSEVLQIADSSLTDAEKDIILHMGSPPLSAIDVSKTLTALFRTPYDEPQWFAAVDGINIPNYMKSITGIICFVLWALEGNWPGEGLREDVASLLDALMGVFSVGDAEWWKETYMPAARKAFDSARLCNDAVIEVLEHFLKFSLTFVEAFVFQEEVIPVPKRYRNIVGWFDRLGLTSDPLSDMKVTWDYYNGYDCKARSDHATWHEKASHGLVHIVKVAELFVSRVKADRKDC